MRPKEKFVDNRDLRMTRRIFLGGGVGAAALTLAGCGFDGSNAPSDDENETGGGPSGTVRLAFGATIDSFDPHYVNQAMVIVPAGLLEGLVFSTEDGTEAVPAAAESWEVSADGTVYTFTMREGALWSNGDPVTAEDAEWSFQRLLTPTGAGTNYAAGASSYLTGLGIKGAAEHLSGALEDWSDVGILAHDEHTLEIELEAPNPDFLLLMSHYSMVLVHPPSLEGGSQEWMEPDNWVGNGAFVPVTWAPTSSIRMVANESYWDYENVGVGEVEMVLGMDGTASMVSFSSGDIDATTANAYTIEEREDLLDSMVQVEGYTMRYLQLMWGGHEAGRDSRVRRALSMAIDREAISAAGGPEGSDVPGRSLLPGNAVPGWDESIAIDYDVDAARQLMADAGLDGEVPSLRIQFPHDDPWLAILADSWREAFDTDVNIEVLESGVHAETRWEPFEDESVISVYGGTFAGVPTMNNWINNIFGPDYVMQFSLSTADWNAYQELETDDSMSGPQKAAALEAALRADADPDAVRFADLAVRARGIVDDEERLQAFLEAAAVREELAYTIPVSWLARTLVVADHVSGFVARPSPEICYYKDIRVDG